MFVSKEPKYRLIRNHKYILEPCGLFASDSIKNFQHANSLTNTWRDGTFLGEWNEQKYLSKF